MNLTGFRIQCSEKFLSTVGLTQPNHDPPSPHGCEQSRRTRERPANQSIYHVQEIPQFVGAQPQIGGMMPFASPWRPCREASFEGVSKLRAILQALRD